MPRTLLLLFSIIYTSKIMVGSMHAKMLARLVEHGRETNRKSKRLSPKLYAYLIITPGPTLHKKGGSTKYEYNI
jgi:hypothetical protein